MKIMSIDLSTNSTGYSVFSDGVLEDYGYIKGKNSKEKNKFRATLEKLNKMAQDIKEKIDNENPDIIVIEEIAGSANRLSQKTLDIAHGILWTHIFEYLDKVVYFDVSGSSGWRTHLQLKLNEADKLHNKEARTLNKKLKKGQKKIHIIGPKHLACRYVNHEYGLKLDPEVSKNDTDIADSIAMGSAYIKFYVQTTKN